MPSSSTPRAGQTTPSCRRALHVRLRDDPTVVLRVPPRRVLHMPQVVPPPATAANGNPNDSATNDRRSGAPTAPPLFLCPAFARTGGSPFANPATGCPAAPGTCPDVHADVSTATRLHPHRRLDGDGGSGGGGPYTKHQPPLFDPSVGTLLVAAPNEQVATLRVAAGECLATRALEAARSPLSLCAHYLGPKAACDYGAACQFVHPAPGAAITADPAAVPAPHPLRSLIDLVAVDTAYPPTDAAARGIGSTPGTVAPPSTPGGGVSVGSAVASGSNRDAPSPTDPTRFQHDPTSPHEGSDDHGEAALPRRFQHDPYLSSEGGVQHGHRPPPSLHDQRAPS